MIGRHRVVGFYLILLLSLWSLSALAQEGYVIQEETRMPPMFGEEGRTYIIKTWMTEDKLRRDEGERGQTTIIRSDLGKIWVIDHADTTYSELTQEMFQGLAVMGLMMFGVTLDSVTGKPIIPDPLFKKTGRRKSIGNWDCHEVVLSGGEAGLWNGLIDPVVMWVSGNTGLEKGLYGRLMRRMMGELGEEYDAFFKQLDTMEGYPVLLETRAMGIVVGQELKSVERLAVSSSVFNLPAGYRKVDPFTE